MPATQISEREEVLLSKGYSLDQKSGGSPPPFMEKVVIDGTTVYVSGHTSTDPVDKEKKVVGKVPSQVSIEQAKKGAEIAAAALLRTLRDALGSLDRVDRVLRLTGYVNADLDFKECSQVIHGASELVYAVFGEAGRHARTALGMAQLPAGVSVEVEMIFRLKA